MGKKKGKQRAARRQQQNQQLHRGGKGDSQSYIHKESIQENAGDKMTNKKTTKTSSQPVGLSNLGNTCFFNSVMQNLLQVPLLDQLLKQEIEMAHKQTVVNPDDDSIPSLTYTPAPLFDVSLSLSKFYDSIKTMLEASENNSNGKKNQRDKSCSPRELFNRISAKNERFRGYQQQDSQELYHCLLDCIKSEEVKRKKKGILKALGLTKRPKDEIPEEVLQRVRAYGKVVSQEEDTLVEKVFGGYLVSSVLCDGCGTVTAVTEPFYDISLPIIQQVRSNPRNKKTNNSSEEQTESHAVENGSDTKPLSKHAMKKQRKQEEKKLRQLQRKLKFESKQAAERVDSLADSVAMDAITQALESLSLNNRPSSSVEDSNLEDDDEVDPDALPRLKGGALEDELNLPADHSTSTDMEDQDPDKEVLEEIGEVDKEIVEESSETDMKILEEKDGIDEEVLKEKDGIDEEVLKEKDGIDEEVLKEKDGIDEEVLKEKDGIDEEVLEEKNGIDEEVLDEKDGIDKEVLEEKNGTDDQIVEKSSLLHSDSNSDKGSDSENTPYNQGDSLFDTPHRIIPKYERVEESSRCLPVTLVPRDPSSVPEGSSLESSFYRFTMPEMLTGLNKFGCKTCTKRQQTNGEGGPKTVYCNASKQMLINLPPAVLTIHLKRFQQVQCRLRKVNSFVEFPLVLDIAPFCSLSCQKYAEDGTKIRYVLSGMVEHIGTLARGHYTAFVRTCHKDNVDSNPDSGVWYHISDSIVTKITAAKALKCNAYLLFYQRVNSPS